MRLVSFGCSFTYGESLEDCIAPNDAAYVPPSKLSWPNIVANHFSYDHINLSYPGSSNHLIADTITHFNWQPDDVAVVLFTFPNRYSIFMNDSNLENITPNDVNIPKKKAIATNLYDLFSDYHLLKTDITAIDHVFYYLSYHQIPSVCRLIAPHAIQKYRSMSTVNDQKWIGDISQHNIMSDPVDYGADNLHPGPLTHQLFAESILQNVDDIRNMRE